MAGDWVGPEVMLADAALASARVAAEGALAYVATQGGTYPKSRARPAEATLATS